MRRVYRFVRCSRIGVVAAAALVVAGCTSAAHLGPGPESPPVALTLTIDGKTYTVAPGQVATKDPIEIRLDMQVSIALGVRTPSNAKISNVWLTITGRTGSGMGGGHPIGKFKLLAHQSGTLNPSQRLTATWTAARLFDTAKLNLEATFSIDDTGTGTRIAVLEITR